MGWSIYDNCKTVEDITAVINRDMERSGWRILAQKRTREGGGLVLWTLVQVHERDDISQVRTFITCDLLRKQDGVWAHKGMDEGVHPYCWSCPESFLARAPMVNAEWRAKVRQFHAAKKATPKLAAGQVYELGPGASLGGENLLGVKVQVVTARPLVVEFVEATAKSPGLKGFRAKVSQRALVPVMDVREAV